MQLLVISSTLNSFFVSESFKINDIYQLVVKFYQHDFIEYDKIYLKMQLYHYKLDVLGHPNYKSLSTISELYQWLVRTKKSVIYSMFIK